MSERAGEQPIKQHRTSGEGSHVGHWEWICDDDCPHADHVMDEDKGVFLGWYSTF